MSQKGTLKIRKGNENNVKAQLLARNNANEELNEEEEKAPNINNNNNSPNNNTESVVTEISGKPTRAVSGTTTTAVSGTLPTVVSGTPSTTVSGTTTTAVSGTLPTVVSGTPTTTVSGLPTTTKYSYTDVKHKVDQYKTQDPKQILDNNTGTSSDITDTLYLEQNLINVLNKSNENDNKTLGKILNDYFNEKVDGWVKLNEANINFIDVDNQYAKDIDNAIQKDTKNKVAIFEYELPLYNLDSLSAFIANLSNNNDLLDQYKIYITNFLQKINSLYTNFNVKDYGSTNKNYLTMYMPKLLNENRFDINSLTRAQINKLAGGTITKINNIKKNSAKTSITKKQMIRNNFTTPTDEWTNMHNNKNKMYGFNTDEFKGIEFSLYSPEVSQYFNKCDDLQIFYIKKHIELFNSFKQMKKLIDFNVIINYSILELLDPDKAPLDTKGDMVELKHVFDKQTELVKLLKMQSDILSSKDSMKGGSVGAPSLSKTAASVIGPTQLTYDLKNRQIELTNLLLKLKTKIKPNDVVYIELNADKKMLMKYEKQDADKYIFSNINIFNKKITGGSDDKINDFLSDFNKLTALDQETKTKLMNYILKGDSEYETLSYIKKIHDQNIDSLNVYLAEGTSLSLQDRIDNYEKEISNYDSDIKVAKPKETGKEWKTTEYNTANTMYFDPINNTKPKYKPKEVKNTGSAQRVIYKCYDLQILYLIKHLEVIEMFKIEFYFADMLFKHFALLLFIIALYKRDFTDKGPNVTPEIREYIKNIPKLLSDQSSTIIMKGGAAVEIDPTAEPKTETIDTKVESAIDKLETEINDKLELIAELEKTTKESGPNEQIDLEVKLLKAASEKLKLLKQTTYEFDEPIFARLQKQDDKMIQEITEKYDDIYQTYETKIPQQNKEIALEIQKLKIKLQKKICPVGNSCTKAFNEERLTIMRDIIKSYKERFAFVFGNSIITDDENNINDYIKLLHIIRIYDLANPIFEKNLKNSKILETEKVQKIQEYIKAITDDLKLKDKNGTIDKMGTASIYLLKQALDKDAKEEAAKRAEALKKTQLEKQKRDLEKITQEAKKRAEEVEEAEAAAKKAEIEKAQKLDKEQEEEKQRLAKEQEEERKQAFLAQKEKLEAIIEFLNETSFNEFKKFIDDMNDNIKKIEGNQVYINNKQMFDNFTAAYDNLLLSIESETFDINDINAKFEELKEKYENVSSSDIIDTLNAELAKKSINDLKNNSKFLNLIKPLSVCYSKIKSKNKSEQINKIKPAIDEFSKLGINNVTNEILLGWMTEADEINNKLKQLEETILSSGTTSITKEEYEIFVGTNGIFDKFYDSKPKELSNPSTIRMLFEKICGAAMVIIRTRPQNNDNTALPIQDIITYMKNKPEYKNTSLSDKELIDLYTVRDYMTHINRYQIAESGSSQSKTENISASLKPKKNIADILSLKLLELTPTNKNNQVGGYKYSDILVIEKDKLKLGGFCNEEKQLYGPFAGLYTPEYNNFDIFAYLFGINKLRYKNESEPAGYETRQIKEPNEKETSFGKLSYKENTPQNLMEKLNEGGNIVIFGFGFSGSGKTYALLEGQSYNLKEGSKYDPSLLEQFMKDNSDKITTIEFVDIYPLGIPGADGNIKRIFCGTDVNAKDLMIYDDKFCEKNNMYDKLEKGTNYADIKKKVDDLATYRRQHLRILATPNNDESSRSFLQITISLSGGNKLIFFDMPGSENTVRIKTEFFGSELFSKIEGISIGSIKGSIPEGTTDLESQKVFDKAITIYDNGFNIKDNLILYLNKYEKNVNAIHHVYFKNMLIQGKKFLEFSSLFGKVDVAYTKIADIILKLTLFLNGKSSSNILDLELDEKIKQIDDKIIEQIVLKFLKDVIFKKTDDDEKNSIDIKNITNFRYFNLVKAENIERQKLGKQKNILYNEHFKLEEDDKKNIERIYEIKFKKDEKNIYWAENGTPDLITEKSTMALFGIHGNEFDFKNKKDYIIDNNNKFDKKTLYKPSTRLIPDIRLLTSRKLDSTTWFTFEYSDKNKPNVMIKYFIMIMNAVLYNFQFNIDKNFYGIMLFYIYKYVNFIVKQGEAIVTNLEHLKFFFLSNTDNIGNYNAKCDSEKNPKKKFDCSDIKKCDLVNSKKTYNVKTSVAKGKSMNETVNMGQMNDFRLLSILQHLANRNANIKTLSLIQTNNPSSKSETTLDLSSGSSEGSQNATFVMFTNIKIFRGGDLDIIENLNSSSNPDNGQKIEGICIAEKDTLDFAQSISSTTQTVETSNISGSQEPSISQPSISQFTNKTSFSSNIAGTPTYGSNLQGSVKKKPFSITNPSKGLPTLIGGAITTESTNHKFNMKDLIKKQKTVENKNKTRRRIISIKNNSQKKKLFSTKTKKNKK
jgi:hypothetical protein